MAEQNLLEGVKAVWESDRYDMPLGGHAWHNGDYGVFKILNFATAGLDDVPPTYGFYRAKSPEAAIRLLAIRQMFEDLVGHHCTYGVSGGYDPNKAIDFEGYYGRGKPRHSLRAYLDDLPEDVEYVGDFVMSA